MKYLSTRGGAVGYSFEDAVLEGLSPDGGLFIPESIPTLPADWAEAWANLPFADLATRILRLFIDESEIPTADLAALVAKSYRTFRHPEVTPVRPLGHPADRRWVLELFHGPTFAFKDVALQFLGNLFEYFLERRNQRDAAAHKEEGHLDPHFITVVGATSGDTGSAAIYGLRNKKNVQVFILHPKGRVSPIQEAQMTTVLDPNIHNLAVQGTFDDCQDIVKALFGNPAFRTKHHLGAINSINWARILAQTVYYFHSYFAVQRQLREQGHGPANLVYTVPSGNFGDVLAGFYAKQLGLPIQRLVVATNANDILDRFFTTGRYEKSTVTDAAAASAVSETLSPAMDILVSSNFERLLWYLARDYAATAGQAQSGNNNPSVQAGEMVRKWMDQFKTTGSFTVDASIHQVAQQTFGSVAVSDADTLDTIHRYYRPAGWNGATATDSSPKQQPQYLLDPHTAVGVKAAEVMATRHPDVYGPTSRSDAQGRLTYTICLSTAHPAKFSAAVTQALTHGDSSAETFQFDDVLPPEFVGLLEKPRRCIDVAPGTVEKVKETIEETLGPIETA
ncbi:threonine synthase [Dimargaris cristalligena]|nr:threonine synthase [Dimargaris cristalligena]